MRSARLSRNILALCTMIGAAFVAPTLTHADGDHSKAVLELCGLVLVLYPDIDPNCRGLCISVNQECIDKAGDFMQTPKCLARLRKAELACF